ncbi:MAG: prepilin peptidase [Rickettsiales bacterium]|nr:prepilin peptidase [Rickettsiales bacterium]
MMIILFFIAFVCIFMLVSDIKVLEISDDLQFVFLFLNILYVCFKDGNLFKNLLMGFAGAFVYFSFIVIINVMVLSWKKKKGIGGADVKFITFSGVTLGFLNVGYFFLIAGSIGYITAILWNKYKKQKQFPFSIGLVISYLTLMIMQFNQITLSFHNMLQ